MGKKKKKSLIYELTKGIAFLALCAVLWQKVSIFAPASFDSNQLPTDKQLPHFLTVPNLLFYALLAARAGSLQYKSCTTSIRVFRGAQ